MQSPLSRQPSRAWITGSILAVVIALAAGFGALAHQRRVTRPVGEGELFAADATWAGSRLATSDQAADVVVREIRNELEIEAVSLVGPDGLVGASTSPDQVGREVKLGLLRYGLSQGFFAAIASPVTGELSIDGIAAWSQGDVLYQVIQPLSTGEGLILYYDISALLSRRAANQGVQPVTLQLLGVSGFFVLAAVGLLVARALVGRRIHDLDREAQFLRQRSAELEEHNLEVSAARAEAERALALAEEKNRIRAEFVLMINHELRTPLTSLVTGAELLRGEDSLSSMEQGQLLDHMVADGKRLQEMIAQMLTVARVENRGLAYSLQETSLGGTLASLAEKAPRLRIRWDNSVDADQVTLLTDRMTLTQLIASLADNALTHGATKVDLVWRTSLPFDPMHEVGSRPDQTSLSDGDRQRPRNRHRLPPSGLREVREAQPKRRNRARALHRSDDVRGALGIAFRPHLRARHHDGDRHSPGPTRESGERGMKKALLLIVAFLGLSGCGPSVGTGLYQVSMSEFDINTSNEAVLAGTVDIAVSNDGSMPHTLVIADESGRVRAATDPIEAGNELLVTVDLPPGRYQLTCRIVFRGEDGILVDHFQQGMVASLDLIG